MQALLNFFALPIKQKRRKKVLATFARKRLISLQIDWIRYVVTKKYESEYVSRIL